MADDISKRIARFIEPFQVSPGSSVKLARDFDPGFKAGIEKKKDGVDLLQQGIELLTEYQAKLAAQDTYGVLVVLQALDAAGKDGTIRHVMTGLNPQGVRVESFKVPSALELGQDFLRRYQERLPSRGEIGIFNRSHYEEVLVVRVHPDNLVRQRLPVETREHHVWKRRYDAINDWERYLSENGFRIVKLFLNLSKEEQRVRFLRRIDLPSHNWKFSSNDVEERQSWDAYQEAFSEMFSHTSTAWAPWYVIPADRKWFARTAAAAVIANALIEIDPQYPALSDDALHDLETARLQLEAEAPSGVAADPFESNVSVETSGTRARQEG
jgi:PPK2 family polyphosphate:nucleotide phosphotransferase